MAFKCRQSILFLSAIAISCLASSCDNNKVTECNNMLATANQNTTQDSISPDSQGLTPEQTRLQAGEAKQKAVQLEALQLKDPKLQSFRTELIKVFIRQNQALIAAAQAAEDGAKVANKVDAVSADASSKSADLSLQVAEVYNKQITVIGDLTTYCTK
jgi:hypothetical protein